MFLFVVSSSSLLPLSGSSWMFENLQGVPIFFMLPFLCTSLYVGTDWVVVGGEVTPSWCPADAPWFSLGVCWARRRLKSCKCEISTLLAIQGVNMSKWWDHLQRGWLCERGPAFARVSCGPTVSPQPGTLYIKCEMKVCIKNIQKMQLQNAKSVLALRWEQQLI